MMVYDQDCRGVFWRWHLSYGRARLELRRGDLVGRQQVRLPTTEGGCTNHLAFRRSLSNQNRADFMYMSLVLLTCEKCAKCMLQHLFHVGLA